jgi:hypothetical protein
VRMRGSASSGALAATSARVTIGGDFTKAGELDQAHYAQFPVS